VIAAGWAVDDAAAKLFAVTFYQGILRGCRFIDAIGEAREAAWGLGGNTWAAYQCYGDPDWTLRKETSDPQRRSSPSAERFSGIASPHALVLTLNNLAVDSQYHRAPEDSQRSAIRYLEGQFEQCWGEFGSVAEAFGWAWSQVGDKAAACSWYGKALKANDGTASIKCIEQLHNLRVRQAWDKVRQGIVLRDKAQASLHAVSAGDTSPRLRTRQGQRRREAEGAGGRIRMEALSQLSTAEEMLKKSLRIARKDINAAIHALEKLTEVETTSERESLLGSAYKRLAMVDGVEGRNTTPSLKGMEEHYRRAESLARTSKLSSSYYPALNRMAAELILKRRESTWAGFDVASVAVVRQNLESQMAHDPDFWAAVSLIELKLYEAIAAKNLSTVAAAIQSQYEELHARVSARWMWGSAADQLRFLFQGYASDNSGDGRALEQLLKVIDRLADDKSMS
jgi:tetratricopeptide (TPR) repeat protein